MEKYHIYEEIGKGKFSQVFKGREKKKIEYVAIKRIEKSVMNKIVSEVQIMHKLSHIHMLRFYDWYETRNNLWLILEYCTGGDLESILKQDGHLPESSIRIFGRDIISGLKYLHSNGIIHCDLRPCNFLVDEYGILKLSDFKFARKIPKDPLNDTPISERGTAAYLSPELFSKDGAHSFQSDFWALGCVLYELRRGFLPFGDASNGSLDTLVDRIKTIDPIDTPYIPSQQAKGSTPSLSNELADCLSWLLEKGPMNRCAWPALCSHPFWGQDSTLSCSAAEMPTQPAFEKLTRDMEKIRSEQLEEATSKDLNFSYNRDISGSLHEAKSNAHGGHSQSNLLQQTPMKMPVYGSTPSRTEDKQEHKQGSVTPSRVNTLSRIEEKTPLVNQRHVSNIKDSNLPYDAPEEHTPRHHIPVPIDAASNQSNNNHSNHSPYHNNNEGIERSNRLDMLTVNEQTQKALEDLQPTSLLQHSSESQVKPIVGNKVIEIMESFDYQANVLPFPFLSQTNIVNASAAELESHLTIVYKALHKTAVSTQAHTVTNVVLAEISSRINSLKYLCHVATNAEGANIIANTPFLALLLKILRTSANYTTATPARGSSGQTMISQANSLFQTSKYWSATLVAMMLRYATFVQPPNPKQVDEHLLGTFVGLLKEKDGVRNASMESKVKKRIVAALGEIVFYITAQEEEDSNEKWILAIAAVETLAKCLREENEEVVKHYAAKTIENVLAQGGLIYKFKFISFDIALKLLELSQNSVNEALQATCATALSHMIYLVLTLHHYVDTPAYREFTKTTAHSITSPQSSARKQSPSSAASPPDPFQNPVIVSSSKFVAKLLEKANLPGFIEALKEGQIKVQQSFLNIANFVFCTPLARPADDSITSTPSRRAQVIDSTHETFVKTVFTPFKSYVLRSHVAILPGLFRMMEQGSVSLMRSKAVLFVQLLCAHLPSALVQLGERRLPSLIIRVLEPALANGNIQQQSSSLYLVRAVLSLALHFKLSCEQYMGSLADHLDELAGLSHDLIAQVSDPSPGKRKNGGFTSPSPRSPNSKEPSSAMRPVEKLSFTAAELRNSSELLRSLISLVSAQPALSRLIIGGNSRLVRYLSRAVRALPMARSAILSVVNKQFPMDMKESILNAEQVCMALMESLAQIDIPQCPAVTEEKWPWRLDWAGFVLLSLNDLLPSMSQLLGHPDGDIRTVIIACLRRILPQHFRVLLELSRAEELQAVFNTVLQSLSPHISPLLTDQAPIPQYLIRLLVDIMSLDKALARSVVQLLSNSSALPVLMAMMRNEGGEEEDKLSTDTQLIVLMHAIFEDNTGAGALLQLDLGGALSICSIGAVYSSIQVPFHQAREPNTDLLVSIAEFLYHVLHYVLKEVSTNDTGRGARSPQKHVLAEQHRKQLLPSRATSPALLLLMGYVDYYLSSYPPPSDLVERTDSSAYSSYHHLLELGSRCLGLLFDLYPDALTSQLLSKQSIALDSPALSQTLFPRHVLASVLKNKKAELKIKVKILKILFGMIKVSSSTSTTSKTKELMLSEPLHSVLLLCSKSPAGGAARSPEPEAAQVLARIAMQIMDAASAME